MQEDNPDLARILELDKSPYINPLRYEHFDEIQVPLHLISASSCFLLDQSVEMAKKWCAPVHLHVAEGLPHSFQMFFFMSAACKRAAAADCVITLKRLCEEKLCAITPTCLSFRQVIKN